MIQALARRFRQWLRRPELPVGDVAGESWSQIGPLPPARLMGLDEPGLIPLDLPAPPPVPMDARPPRTREELEWEALLAKMLSHPDAAAAPASISTPDTTSIDPDPTPSAPLVMVPVVSSADPTLEMARQEPTVETAGQDDDDWDALIARARGRMVEPALPVVRTERRAAMAPAPTPVPELIEDDGDWETLIAAAKSRPAPAPARPTVTLVRTPPPVRLTTFARDPRPVRDDEERAWEQLIARAKRRATSAPAPSVAAPRRRPGHETGDWSAVIAAAKLRYGLHGRA